MEFEYEITPLVCVFKHLIPDWRYCVGRLYNLEGMEPLEEVSHWGRALKFYSLALLPGHSQLLKDVM